MVASATKWVEREPTSFFIDTNNYKIKISQYPHAKQNKDSSLYSL